MKSQPLISVIIPTYNRSYFLKQAINSVVNQTYSNIEIIVVDDGTPNNENEKLCSEYNNLTYIKINNSGSPCKPRNIGIRNAKGKYLAFLDDDDLWELNRLDLMVEILEKYDDYGLVHSYCSFISDKGNKLKGEVGRPAKPSDKHGEVKFKMIGNWTISDYPLVKKEVVEKVGWFNEDMIAAGEDVEYWARCSFFTKFYYLDLPLTRYRLHDGNNSIKNKKKYLTLNLFLKRFINSYLLRKIINKKDYQILIQSLVKNQIKNIKSNYLISLNVLFKLNPFWVFKFENIKLLVFILLKR